MRAEAFTLRVNLQYNFIDGPLTPFVMAGIGHICTSVQPTKSFDSFVYQIGRGGRWDLSDSVSARLSIEHHWLDLGNGSPSVIQAKLVYSSRY